MICKSDIETVLEQYARSYENAIARSGEVRLEDFLPPRSHDSYAEIALELLRIELEHSWGQNRPRPLDEYRRRFPDVLGDLERLEQLAFEEYRQRVTAGYSVDHEEYRHTYGINVSRWTINDEGRKLRHMNASGRDDGGDRGGWAHNSKFFPAGRHAGSPVQWPIVGQQFGDFELIDELGRGSFARVFLARQTALAERTVALKVTRGFSAEPDRLAQLQHSHIVPIFSVHEHDGFEAVCMPYLGRHTLAHVMDHIRRIGRLPNSGREFLSTIVATAGETLDGVNRRTPAAGRRDAANVQLAQSITDQFNKANYVDAAVWIVERLARGLAHAHERGILHRDLKPANVLISNDGRPMILDFNLSEQFDELGVRPEGVGGTLPYMSPEQLDALHSGVAVDVRSDVYSLGVIFYELLAGELPFETLQGALDDVAGLASARRRGATNIRVHNKEVPASVANVVARCLAPSPADRYQTAEQLQQDLDNHLNNRPLRFAADRSPRERIGKWVRRNPRLSSSLTIGSLAAILMLTLGIAWAVRGTQLNRHDANEVFNDFTERAAEARIPLSLVGDDAGSYAAACQEARAQLGRYGVFDAVDWRESPNYLNLDAAKQQELSRSISKTLYMMAAASLWQASTVQPDKKEERELLNAARDYNVKAAEFAAALSPDLRASLKRQLVLIQTWQRSDKTEPFRLFEGAMASSDREIAAVRLLQNGRYQTALPLLLEWRDQDQGNLTAWMLLGSAYAGIGDAAEAENCFTTCTRLRPQFSESYFQRGLARHQQKTYAAAVRDFSKYMDLQGASPAALINRALAYQAMADHRSSLKDLDAAAAMGAPQTRVYFIRAAVRGALGDAAGARLDFERGLALTPSDCKSWLARGMARLRKQPEIALTDFQKALQLDPGNRVAAQNILHVLSDRLGQGDDALALCNELIDANPKDAQALYTRAVLRARQGDVESAAADANEALALEHSPKAILQAACAFAQMSRSRPDLQPKALKLVASAVGAQPDLAIIAVRDPDLAPIRDEPAFSKILNAAKTIRTGGFDDPQEAVAAR